VFDVEIHCKWYFTDRKQCVEAAPVRLSVNKRMQNLLGFENRYQTAAVD
jgi:hypothetical protein